jgi:hypothetical protein
MIKYKLTDRNMQTRNNFQWELGKLYEVKGEGDLCTNGWFHFYDNPELAVLLNPIHANINNPRLFEAEVSGKHKDNMGLKYGWQKARLVRELPAPKFTENQVVAFGIYCAKEVYKNADFSEWANNWLSGKDRTAAAARTTAATWTATRTAIATRAAAWAAAEATWAAAWAATRSAAWVTTRSVEAAWAAAWAVRSAKRKLNFPKIIKKANKIK